MKLSTWIMANGGVVATSDLLGVHRIRVHYWRRGINLPRAAIMADIVRRSQGKVSYAEMIEDFLDGRKQGKVSVKKNRQAATKKHRVSKRPCLGF